MFVQTYWMNQSLDTNLDYDLESFKEAIFDLKRICKKIYLFKITINQLNVYYF